MTAKPLGHKAYGHIPHLPGSRMGPADKQANPGHAAMCTGPTKHRGLTVYAEEKLDGTCVAVAKVGGILYALGKAGYPANTSPYEMHHMFHEWVHRSEVLERFDKVLQDGERIVGEWLVQAHGTRYDLPHEPFVAFDIMRGHGRVLYKERNGRLRYKFTTPCLIYADVAPVSIQDVQAALEPSRHAALDPVEGAVWRVERDNKVFTLAKWVRPDKIDGKYLPEKSGEEPVWNSWRE